MIADPWFYCAAVPAVLIAGVSKGGFGAGLGVVAVPMMALVLPPVQVAAIMLPILCLMDLVGVWAYWRKWDGPVLRRMALAAVIGIAVGTLTFHLMAPWSIRLLVGAIALGFAANYAKITLHGKRSPPRAPGPASGWFWGAVSGFTSFTAHAGGPPVNVYLLPLGLEKTRYQATTVGFFLLVNYVKLVPYAGLGLFTGENLATSAALFPVAVGGNLAGIWLHHRVPTDLFYTACYVFLALTGVKLVWDGLAGAGLL
ncbi:MAG: sulfite exporter TauE/SafE family protein [Kiloniellaceae bacterium]